MTEEQAAHEGQLKKWHVGKLFWIGPDLYEVTKIHPKPEESNLVPMDVKKVEW